MTLRNIFGSLSLVAGLLFVQPVFAKTAAAPLQTITPANFDQILSETDAEFQALVGKYSLKKLEQLDHIKNTAVTHLSADEVHARDEYKKLLERKVDLDFMRGLRDALVKQYQDNAPSPDYDRKALHDESTLLSVGLIHEIARLKEKYHSFFMPVVHNMMISVGMRKRGACKHWAEDLLTFMLPIDRKFFYLNWGEAHPGKVGEHNVAVLIPKGTPFEKGLFIDPWRTSGKPFWLKIPDDKHYHWKRWEGWDGL